MSRLNLPIEIDWNAPALDEFARIELFKPDADLLTVSRECRGDLCYLASPYTRLCQRAGGFDAAASARCGIDATEYAARLALVGVTAISPIALASMMVSMSLSLKPLDGAFWGRWCQPLLRKCSKVIVLPLPGYMESTGVWHEVRHALQSQKRVYVLGGGV